MERAPVYFKEIELNGVKYIVNHPQVEEAWEIGIELTKMVGGPVASMASASGNQDRAADALGSAVAGLLQKIDAKSSMVLMKKILRYVEAQTDFDGNPKKIQLDDAGIKKHFHARIGSMMKLVGEVLAFTHTDFFDAIADGVANLMKMIDEKTGEAA